MKTLLRFRHSLPPGYWIFAAVLLVRLLALARLSSSPFLLPSSGDMHFYNAWAQRILRGELTDHLAFYGLPLYAYVLALLYRIVGYNPFVPGLLQACLDAGTAVLIYAIALNIFGRERRASQAKLIGLTAALAWALFVPAQAYAAILMPTTWFVFVFWFVVWRIVRSDNAPSSKECVLLGLLIGVTAMGVATILFLVPLLLAALLTKPKIDNGSPPQAGSRATSTGGRGSRPGWSAVEETGGESINHAARLSIVASATLLLAGVGLGTSPCWMHNYFVARDPVFLSAHSGINLWIGNNPAANGYPRFPPGLRAGQAAMLKDSIAAAETAAGHPLKRSEVSAYWSGQARAYIGNNFGAWLQLIGVKLRNFWNAFQYDDLSIITILREQGIILPGLSFGIIVALAGPGMLLAWRFAPPSRWVSAAILLHMAALLPVFVTERYRLAVVPGLLLFAAFGLSILWQSCALGNYRRCAIYAALLVGSTIFVSWPQRDPSLWALDAYNSGWQALESNNLPLAEKKLGLAYAYVPENAEINFALGNLRLAQGNKPAAKFYYLSTLRLDPNHEGSYNNLGILALEEKLWSLAAKFFAKAVQQNPRDGKTYYLLAKALFAEGNWAAANSAIEKAIELTPVQPEFVALREEIARHVR